MGVGFRDPVDLPSGRVMSCPGRVVVSQTRGERVRNWFARLVSPIRQGVSHIGSIYNNFERSKAGHYVVDSIKENALEVTGGLLGGMMGDAVFSTSGENMGNDIGGFVGTVATVGVSTIVMYSVYRCQKTERTLPGKIKKGAIAATAGATAILISGSLPRLGACGGAMIGKQIGSFFGYQAGAIVGGYVAIKAFGSGEVLIDSKEFHKSYAVKVSQSNVSTYLSSKLVTTSLFTGLIREQMIASLAFHSITVFYPLMNSILEGRVLDDVLPEGPPNIPESVFKELGTHLSRSSQGNKLMKFVSASTIDFLSGLREYVPHATGVMMRAFNSYSAFIMRSPTILEAQHAFKSALLELYQTPEHFVDNARNFQMRKTELIRTIELESRVYLNHEHSEIFHRIRTEVEREVETFLNGNRFEEFLQSQLLCLRENEKRIFPVGMTQQMNMLYTIEFVKIHLKTYSIFAGIEAFSLRGHSEEATREFYLNFNQLLSNYFSTGIEFQFPIHISSVAHLFFEGVSSGIATQIRTAKLMDVM